MIYSRFICCLLMALVSHTINAQHIGCVQVPQNAHAHASASANLASDYQMLPDPVVFDRQKIYRQPVVLISYSDMDFSMANPAEYYNSLFNEKGFNEGMGLGCVADYFREQSDSLVNLQFDIYGPIQVSEKAGEHRGIYYGNNIIRESIKKLRETEQTDFAIYDWDGDSLVNQVLFIASGPTGNRNAGYLWPNSGFTFLELPGGIKCQFSSISCELWDNESTSGIGTIIHEFGHCLGLPDIYPLAPSMIFSVVDEWDIMDGGNFTNKGWCPPNFSTMEKMYLGWLSPTELTESAKIQNMRPMSDKGECYIIRSSGNNNEFYLLENRRQEGWDYGCPGDGLLIFHVDYDKSLWCNNIVNNYDDHYRYQLFHADGKDYNAWDSDNNGNNPNKYTMDNWLRSCYLSTSPYPYTDPTTNAVVDSLTDNSDPAAVLFTANAEGKNYMSKAITNIQLSEDGTISFDFMKPDLSEISDMIEGKKAIVKGWYDLNGRRLSTPPLRSGVYITLYSDGTKEKCLRK